MSYQTNTHGSLSKSAKAGVKVVNYKYAKSISEYRQLTKKEEFELSEQIQNGGKQRNEAINKLICHNTKLVITIAGAYTGMGLDMDDLISEGNIGLYEAAIRFDPSKGAKFSSYSSFWIKQKMRKALTTKSRNIRVPNSSLEKFNQVCDFINSYEEQNGFKPTQEEIAEGIGSTCKRVNSVVNAALGTTSLDAEVAREGGDGDELYSLIEDENMPAASEEALALEAKKLIHNAVYNGKLTDRERKIIEGRFGFNKTGNRMTLEKIGSSLKVTRERVRQIETVALCKIKSFLKSKNFKK
jgi:RNA polymerase primary sigma factor